MNEAHDAEGLRALGRALAVAQDRTQAREVAARRERQRARFLEAAAVLPARSRTRPRRSGWAWGIGGAAAAAVLVAGFWHLRPPATSDVVVEGISTSITAPQNEPLLLEFGRGGRAELDPRARVRVLEEADGTRVALQRGGGRFELPERAEAAMQVEAGPYSLRFASATFDVRWAADVEVLEVEVHQGIIALQGPRPGDARELHPGEVIKLQRKVDETPVRAAEPPPEVVAPQAEEPVTRAPARRDEASKRPRRARGAPAPQAEPAVVSWEAMAEAGDYAAAIEAARAEGFESLCRTLGASELLRLADVARYAGQRRLATHALGELRARFPGSDAAATAAFDLARLHTGDCERTRAWLQTYLRERPDGAMVEEARRRLGECQSR